MPLVINGMLWIAFAAVTHSLHAVCRTTRSIPSGHRQEHHSSPPAARTLRSSCFWDKGP